MKTIFLSAVIALSATVASANNTPFNTKPKDNKDFIMNPVLTANSCFKQLIGLGNEHYNGFPDFEGPYMSGNAQTMEIRVYSYYNIRIIGYKILVTTTDSNGWREVNPYTYNDLGWTASSANRIAEVHELLRGGETGYLVNTIDVSNCIGSLTK